MPIRANVLLALMLAFALTACSTPPTAEMDAARNSLANATTAGADKYASESLKAAEEAQSAADAELKAQDARWIQSYDRARELAVAAKAAADKAAADAATGRERAEVTAVREKAAREKAAAGRAKLARAPIRVGGQIKPPVKIKDVPPVYPAVAQSARVQGEVVIEATVGEDGKVADARVVKSIPLLDQAALDAVNQWEYQPSLLNGVPTPVVMTITVRFTRPDKWVGEPGRNRTFNQQIKSLWTSQGTSSQDVIFGTNPRHSETRRNAANGTSATRCHIAR
jgi:TonB family protein